MIFSYTYSIYRMVGSIRFFHNRIYIFVRGGGIFSIAAFFRLIGILRRAAETNGGIFPRLLGLTFPSPFLDHGNEFSGVISPSYTEKGAGLMNGQKNVFFPFKLEIYRNCAIERTIERNERLF